MIESGTPVIVAFPDGDEAWRLIDTGVSGQFDVQEGRFVIPFRDDITADEVARILTGMIRRERDASQEGQN